MTRDQILKRLTEADIIYKEPAKLFSRSVNNFYYNVQKALGYPDILNALADLIGNNLRKEETCIAVSGYGGLPLGSAVASRFNRKLITIRKEKKKYGPKGLVYGYNPTENDTAIILDDVLATGDSVRTLINSLGGTGVKISRAFVVVEIEKVKLPIPYEFIFSVDELKKITPNHPKCQDTLSGQQ